MIGYGQLIAAKIAQSYTAIDYRSQENHFLAADRFLGMFRALSLHGAHCLVEINGDVTPCGDTVYSNQESELAMTNPFDKDVLTTGEVAKICNVAARTVSKWFDSGQIEGYRIPGSKDRRIPVQSLMDFMQEHGIPFDGLMSGNTRVLVVDTDTDVLNTLERVFAEQTEYTVQTCCNPFAAGVECERFRPHVMLFDLSFCNDDDYTAFTNCLRNGDELQATKIIAMSGRLTDGQMTRLTCGGFDGVLRKPFTVRQVIDTIEDTVAVVY